VVTDGLPPISGAGSAPRSAKTLVVALYDGDSGRIRHLHVVYQHEGASDITEAVAVEAAQRHAARLGHDSGSLQAAVSTRPEHASTPHRIDIGNREFVPLRSAEEAT
jgi:hypothetical protein